MTAPHLGTARIKFCYGVSLAFNAEDALLNFKSHFYFDTEIPKFISVLCTPTQNDWYFPTHPQ